MDAHLRTSAAVEEALGLIDSLGNRDAAALHVADMLHVVNSMANGLANVAVSYTSIQPLSDCMSSVVADGRKTSDVRIAALLLLTADALAELLHLSGPAPSGLATAAAGATHYLEDLRPSLDAPPSNDILAQEKHRLALIDLIPRLSDVKVDLRHCMGNRAAMDTSLADALAEVISPRTPNSLVPTLRFSHAGYLTTVDVSGAQIGRGGSGSVFHGAMRVGGRPDTERVAVKVVVVPQAARDPSAGATQVPVALQRELAAWCKLRHARVLPLYATSAFGAGSFALVSPYMPDGDLGHYIRTHPSADTRRLIIDAAEGLCYLHQDAGIVHGDLKCENILVSPAGTALLADFGLSTTVAAADITTATTLRALNTLRHSARELILDEAFTPGHPARLRSKTPMSDVYAFGMVLYQAYSRVQPWSGANDVQLILAIDEGRHPARPSAELLGDALWELCVKCWSVEAELRPTIVAVLEYLRTL